VRRSRWDGIREMVCRLGLYVSTFTFSFLVGTQSKSVSRKVRLSSPN
jgi:hypothetical protein